MHRAHLLLVLIAGSVLAGAALAEPKPEPKPKAASDSKSNPAPEATPAVAITPKVGAPHPMICEILYAVPKGAEGDANKDGSRSATGDEFIEIYNPHAVAIDLKGYVLSDAAPLTGPDRDQPASTKRTTAKKGSTGAGTGGEANEPASKPKASTKRSRLRFEFPALTLQPGEVAVVFNGYESRATGKVGDSSTNAGKNESFGNAYVFTMGVKSQFAALANTGDCVTLFAPDGRAIQCARWGAAEKDKKVDAAILMMEAPESRGSVTLDVGTGQFVEHPAVDTESGQRFFSPGTFGTATPNAPATTQPGKK